jgi:hypothetical protein
MMTKPTFDVLPHELKRKVLLYLVHDEWCITDRYNTKTGCWEFKVMLVVNRSPMGLHIYEPPFHHAVDMLFRPNEDFIVALCDTHRGALPKRKAIETLKDATTRRQKVLDACEHRIYESRVFDHKKAMSDFNRANRS